jgi:hypothetical protein
VRDARDAGVRPRVWRGVGLQGPPNGLAGAAARLVGSRLRAGRGEKS